MQQDDVLRLERAATRDAPEVFRQEIVRFASAAGASDVAMSAVKLAVSEAVTNAVVHAFVGREPGVVSVEARGTRLSMRFTLDGSGSELAPAPDLVQHEA